MGEKQRKGQKEAVENLLTGKVKLVNFSDLLREVWRGEEPLAVRLNVQLTEYEGGKNREKTARKVRNWMHDRNLPQNREERDPLPQSGRNDLRILSAQRVRICSGA